MIFIFFSMIYNELTYNTGIQTQKHKNENINIMYHEKLHKNKKIKLQNINTLLCSKNLRMVYHSKFYLLRIYMV